MRRTIILSILSVLVSQIFAVLTIKGKIIDSTTKSPIDFVNVALLKADTELHTAGVSTDTKGSFLLPQVPKGKYTLRVSFVGYNSLNIPLNVSDKELDLGEIKLFENSKALKEIEVLGQGSQMTLNIDKKVFTVDQNIASAGGSASDVLQNIPSVDVDGEGNVSLRSNGSVEVWINGKPSGLTADNRAQVLQQMPAESIDKVEIMTNPSAKFKPEGTSGIINIVLKKKRKAGYYGSLSAGGIWVDGTKPTATLGVSVNYSSSKLDAYLNVGKRGMNFKGGGYTNRYGINGLDTLFQTSDLLRGYSGLFGRAGIDYHLNEKHTISLSGFIMDGSGYSDSKYRNTFQNASTIKYRLFNLDNTGTGTRNSSSLNLDYKLDIDKLGSNLMASLSYSPHSRTGAEHILQTEVKDGTVSNNVYQYYEGNNQEYEFKIDYTKQFTANSKLELGANSSIETRESPAWATNNKTNPAKEIKSYYNNFMESDQVHALYGTYGSKMGKFSYQGGVRAEYFSRNWDNSYYESETATNITTIHGPNYNKLQFFPSLFIAYSLPAKNELQLNITRRIQRPHGREINPFRSYSDSTKIQYGNPNLLPESSSAFEMNYVKNWDNHTLSASAYYRFTDNVMQQVQFFNANNVMESTTMNVSKSHNMGLELIAKNRIMKVINLTSTLNLYYNKLDSSSYSSIYNASILTKTPEKELFSWSLRSMANVILSKTTFLQLTGDYASPRLISQGTQSASYAFDLGLRQTFMNKNLSLSLMARDIFNTRKNTSYSSGVGFTQTSLQYFMGRMVGLTATYNFGNMKPKQSPIKKESSDMNMGSDNE
ncbi:MAG: hypothetical protein AUK44_04700 [Porphyromonadaceae bacterium CG2_30_38_12]|nr:MAG: hypothetical protein AUK44_04700 [Porphyromonadaceae bacterium CG2_30_38_12]